MSERKERKPLTHLKGFQICPGFYEMNGATAIEGGVNFTVHSHGAYSCELLLFDCRDTEPFAVLQFPEHYRIGDVYSMIVFGLDIERFEYAYRVDGPYCPEKGLLFDKNKYLLDPYARAVTGQCVWGTKNSSAYKARVSYDYFDWEDVKQPQLPMEDLVIYELHVRGFTKDASSGVRHPGTFAGLIEKIPYLKYLGINAVELMPIFEFDEMGGGRMMDGRELPDYWGYNPVGFFAPNTSYTSYSEHNREGTELKRLIKLLHENGMEVILDVVFNHTAEGNEDGPCFSFKGFDNDIYYMLTPEGKYFNFSGCGNTLNCNHPVVRQMILECLRYWVIHYRVDGFRFDLASILGRREDGSPMSEPPLLESLAFDTALAKVKLIAEAWDAGGLYQVGSFPAWNRFAEWNGKYRDDLRSFLKGDDGMARVAAERIIGSLDLYEPGIRGRNASVNFLTCHDGFTLYDLYAYNRKHNEANGWNNTDGTDDNRSWNCGAEGETQDEQIRRTRLRLIKNACAVLLCSRGTPMFFAGDEFGNTQFGNNNSYCQDNEISWLDWSLLEKNRELFEFFRFMITFRREHPAVRGGAAACHTIFPEISLHGTEPWKNDYNWETKLIGVMFAGNREEGTDDIVYLAVNSYWEEQKATLPEIPEGMNWKKAVDTWKEEPAQPGDEIVQSRITVGPRSVVVLTAQRNG